MRNSADNPAGNPVGNVVRNSELAGNERVSQEAWLDAREGCRADGRWQGGVVGIASRPKGEGLG